MMSQRQNCETDRLGSLLAAMDAPYLTGLKRPQFLVQVCDDLGSCHV